jgi:16S rRNA (adenine1518-N6/adenine1519-N6)-dimethyltransferase
MEFLDVVNDRDKVVGRASMKDIYQKSLTHRIVHVFILNDNGDIALQLRSRSKKFLPLHWCTTAGGHVQSGETYEVAARRELKEEVGVTGNLKPVGKDKYVGSMAPPKLLSTYIMKHNGPFTVNSEVEKVEFFGIEKIREMIDNGEKFHPELKFLLDKYFLGKKEAVKRKH